MRIYVGYAITDYATPVCMGQNKEKVAETLKKWVPSYFDTYIKDYVIYADDKQIIKFDCE